MSLSSSTSLSCSFDFLAEANERRPPTYFNLLYMLSSESPLSDSFDVSGSFADATSSLTFNS